MFAVRLIKKKPYRVKDVLDKKENLKLGTALCKLSISFQDAQVLFATIDCPPRLETTLSRVNKMACDITHVVCDGTDKVLDGMQNTKGSVPDKLECVVHSGRAVRRKFYKCKLSIELIGKKSSEL